MLRAALVSLVAAALVHALAVQVPLGSGQPWQDERHPAIDVLHDKNPVEWSLDRPPNPNTTDHLIFETVHSLLQHWPNTRMRNGHNIVPATLAKGTLLYHGAPDHVLPQTEWVATDPEHSYIFCRNLRDPTQKGCWFFTLMVTRPLKVVYFDGSSAAKLYGPLDTQDLVAWGRPADGNLFDTDLERIYPLCDWAKDVGVDGFVRMEMDFEVMLCDFTSGITVVSSEPLSGQFNGPFLTTRTEMFEVMNSGAWHNRFPGETRIQLDLPGMVSFYDTQLAPSLVPVRADQERWDHRAINVSVEDWSTIKSRLEANLLRPEGASSGVDWKTLIQVIVDRFADRLELMRYLLSSSATNPDETLDIAKKVQAQLRIMLTPYFRVSAVPPARSGEVELDWATPIYKLCATTHTRSMESLFPTMTDSEKTILQAIRGTSQEICRVVTKMWGAGVHAGIDPSLHTKATPDIAEVARLRDTWAHELESLMAWLDWSVWVKCNPACGPEEMCYLPTWPVGFPWLAPDWVPPPYPIPIDGSEENKNNFALRTAIMERLAKRVSDAIKPEPDEWVRPEPKCTRRVAPYTF